MKKRLLLCIVVICTSISCTENELFNLSNDADEANSSYEAQFKAIWTAIDLNYPMWDFEREEFGVDWDSIYCKYLPIFQHLDAVYRETGDTTCWFTAQYNYWGMLKNLHDRHVRFNIKDVYSNKTSELLDYTNSLASQSYVWWHYLNWILFSTQYSIDGHSKHKLTATKSNIKFLWWYGLFEDNIVYLHFPQFRLSEIINKQNKTNDEQSVLDIWQTWFNKIQELHNNGTLKGVILDIRHNTGGTSEDYQYFLGALHNEIMGNRTVNTGHYRGKTGIGRYEYSDFKLNGEDFVFHPYEKEHVTVDAPIVVLADSMSASLAEHTCLVTKKIKNAYFIGTNTYGALSPLAEINGESNSFTLLGNIGDPTLTTSSFYISMPFLTFISDNGSIVEGKGVEPDFIVLPSDDGLRDSQLDYALDFITRNN